MLSFIYYNLSFISAIFFGIILLISGWFFYVKKISVHWIQIFILMVLCFLILRAGFETFLQYWAFKSGSPGMYLLPPYQSINYFVSYVWLHFWMTPMVTVSASALFGFAAVILNYFGKNRFFEKEEIFSAILGGLASGWPNFILYLALIIILMIIMNFINLIVYRDSQYRLPSGAFIILAALIVVFIGDYIAPYIGIIQFKI